MITVTVAVTASITATVAATVIVNVTAIITATDSDTTIIGLVYSTTNVKFVSYLIITSLLKSLSLSLFFSSVFYHKFIIISFKSDYEHYNKAPNYKVKKRDLISKCDSKKRDFRAGSES